MRGLTGEFGHPEDSDRCRSLTAAWERTWPNAEPLGYRLREAYAERWVRFHSLPGSKRYAESAKEYAESLRRQRALLDELMSGLWPEHLVVLAEDWGHEDLGTGRTRSLVRDAWPWRRVVESDPDLVGASFIWVNIGVSNRQLDRLLRAIADDRAAAILTVADLSWLFCPYDGGVDVILPDRDTRDALRDGHPQWLSDTPSGL